MCIATCCAVRDKLAVAKNGANFTHDEISAEGCSTIAKLNTNLWADNQRPSELSLDRLLLRRVGYCGSSEARRMSRLYRVFEYKRTTPIQLFILYTHTIRSYNWIA